MSFTFGANTTDDISANLTGFFGGDNTQTLVAGWFYPTTLTATRGYWSAGTIFGAEVDTTTSEIRMRTDNTTDGQWTTSGANISTNKWWFIAWLSATENTSALGAWRVWVGDAETPPQLVTVSVATSPVGNFTGSQAFCIGNKGSAGSLAFQGDIGWVTAYSHSGVAANSPFGVSTSGTLDASNEALTYARWVFPLWRGSPDRQFITRAAYNTGFCVAYFPLNEQFTNSFYQNSDTGIGVVGYTPNATYSDSQPPTRPPSRWVFADALVR